MSVQLTYALTTNPDPLQVNGANATITIIASARYSGAVNITSITVTIPIGTGTQSLASAATTIAAAGPENWTISGNATQGIFTFTPPASGDSGLSSGLVFTFTNITVNASVGSADISIEENNTPSDTLSIPVSKFPADFYLNALTVNPPQVNAGGTTILSWSGSPGYTYAITPAELLSEPIDPANNAGSVTTLPLSGNTIFTLTVSNGDNQGSAVTQEVAGVTVNPPTISDFRIDGGTSVSNVNLGDTLALSWTTTNADNVLVLVDDQAVGFFAADATDATLNAVLGGSYRAVAYYGDISGGIHSPPSDDVTLTLNPPSATLTLSNDAVFADYQSVTLTWTTQNATSAKLQTGASGAEFEVALSENDYAVYPQSTTQYKITAIYSPEQAKGALSAQAVTVPSSMLSASQATTGYQETAVTQMLTMKPCPLQIFTDRFNPGGSNTHTLSSPATKAASYIGGFKYTFSGNDKHDLLEWEGQGTASLDSAGTTLTTACNMVLKDNSDHGINSGATIDTVTVCWNDADTSSFLENIVANYLVHDFTLPGQGYEVVTAGITKFIIWSPNSGHDGKVSEFELNVNQPTSSDLTPSGDNTNVYIGFDCYCVGKQGTYIYGLSFAPLATISNPTGSGFAMAVVHANQSSVTFAQPVKAAYTFLCNWTDSGTSDGHDHTVQLLQSDYVSTVPAGNAVNLTWGTATWDDGDDGPWPATRKIIVLAAFDDQSVTVPPS